MASESFLVPSTVRSIPLRALRLDQSAILDYWRFCDLDSPAVNLPIESLSARANFALGLLTLCYAVVFWSPLVRLLKNTERTA